MRNSKWILALVGLLACGLIAAGCGDDDEDSSSSSSSSEVELGVERGHEFGLGGRRRRVLSSCEETVEGTPGAETAIAACEDAADALEQCAEQAEASGNEDAAETAIAACQAAADEAVKQFESLQGAG